jgi:putative tryptophan/tyrosine transport system substrate-binding protein
MRTNEQQQAAGNGRQWKVFTGALCLMLLMLCCSVEAQQPGKLYLIGYLGPRSAVPDEFIQGLHKLGYIEGQSIRIEPRFAHGKFDQFPRLAAELARLPVDVLVTLSTPATHAAKKATTTIPIVMLAAGHPVDEKLVASLARPGGNITGLTATTGDDELHAKRLELFRETVPKLVRLAVLWDPQRGDFPSTQKRMKHITGLLGLKIQSLEVQSPNDLPNAFQAAAKEDAQAIYAGFRHAPVLMGLKNIVALAIKNRIPAIFNDRQLVESGGLVSYGTSFGDLYRRQATYVDKILKGAKPADLPVEQPTKFEFVINLKTAKQIGLALPPNVLARADRVIR